MGCLYLEIEGQSCLVGSVAQGLMKNGQIDLLDRMTKKEPEKSILAIFPHSDVARIQKRKFGFFSAKLSAFRCHESKSSFFQLDLAEISAKTQKHQLFHTKIM